MASGSKENCVGKDIQLDVKESICESCGDVCGEDVDCRVWTYQVNRLPVMESCCSTSKEVKEEDKCDCSQSDGHQENTEEVCPLCGTKGESVPQTAVINLLKKEYHAQMGHGDFWLCKNPSCQVVYYQGGTEKVFEVDSLKVKVWLKDPGDDVPLCYCHNVTRGQIKIAWRNGAKTFAEIAKTTGLSKDDCNCKVNNPAGRCCFTVINKYLDELASRLGATLELE